MRKILFLFFIVLFSLKISAQEFYCTVQVSTPQIRGTDRKVFETMQKAIFEFINNKTWSNYTFKNEERIECTILITISERISIDEFKGTINLVLRRPIFKTSYNSVLLNYIDKSFVFDYAEYEPLEFSENTFTSNLTSVIAYYINIFLGLEFDSFTLYGGTPFYEKAQAIVNAAQNTNEKGWKAYESQKNRYWLVENLLNPSYSSLRKFIYEYHRKGLDIMSEKAENGRKKIGESINYLKQVNEEKPGLFLLQLILDAKRDEIINIFSEGAPMENTKVVNILKEIDPSNSSKYQKILK
jgi:hypothetical protein